jgi:hypothetical protein
MNKNMGTTDRVIRILLAAVVAILYFTGVISGTTAVILALLGLILLLTSLMSFCPLYLPFKISTMKKQ